MSDHNPSPATDGLREAIEAFTEQVEGSGRRYGYAVAHDLRALLAAHPAPLADPPPEAAREPGPCGICEWDGYPPNGCPHAPADLPVATGVTTEDHSACHPGWECATCKTALAAVVSAGDEGVSGSSLHVTEAARVDSESSDEGEGLAEVLAAHEERRAVGGGGPEFRVWAFCSCDPDHEIYGADMPMTILEHRTEFDNAVRRAFRAHLTEVLVASDWLAARVAEAGVRAGREARDELVKQANARFDEHGPYDARGAALWDAAFHLDPDDGDALGYRARGLGGAS